MTRGAIVRGLRRLTPDGHRFMTPDSDDGEIIEGRSHSFLPSGQAPLSACPHPGAAWSRAPGPFSIFVLAGQGPRRGRSPVERRTARHRSSPARFTFRTRSLHGLVVGCIGSCSSPLQRCYWAAPRRCPVGSLLWDRWEWGATAAGNFEAVDADPSLRTTLWTTAVW